MQIRAFVMIWDEELVASELGGDAQRVQQAVQPGLREQVQASRRIPIAHAQQR